MLVMHHSDHPIRPDRLIVQTDDPAEAAYLLAVELGGDPESWEDTGFAPPRVRGQRRDHLDRHGWAEL